MATTIDGSSGVTFPAGGTGNPAGTVVGTTDTQTLTNKTLTSPVISTISNTGTLTLPTSTDTLVGRATTDTLTNKTLTSPTITGASISGMSSSVITAATSQASTSGTSIDFTGIPSWVKRITVMFQGISTNGSSPYILRLGTSGGFVTSGYAAGGIYTGASTSGGNITSGLLLCGNAIDPAVIVHGHSILTNISGNAWVQSFTVAQSNTAYALMGGGSITLSGVLTQVRITTINGSDAFDAGSINIFYE